MSTYGPATIAEQSRVLAEAMLRLRQDQAEGRGDLEKFDRDLAVLTEMLSTLSGSTQLEHAVTDEAAPYKTRAEAAYELDKLQSVGGRTEVPRDLWRRALSDLSVIARALDDEDTTHAVWNLAARYGVAAEEKQRTADG